MDPIYKGPYTNLKGYWDQGTNTITCSLECTQMYIIWPLYPTRLNTYPFDQVTN
jgi:hypothetical protein